METNKRQHFISLFILSLLLSCSGEKKDSAQTETVSNEHYPLPNTTSEEMERIIRDSEKKKERDNSYFVWGTLIIMGVLIASAVILWAIFIK